jgi:hypothetical protein
LPNLVTGVWNGALTEDNGKGQIFSGDAGFWPLVMAKYSTSGCNV